MNRNSAAYMTLVTLVVFAGLVGPVLRAEALELPDPAAPEGTRAADPGTRSAGPARTHRGHLLIWDHVVVAASLGAVAGVASGRCDGKSFDVGPVVGHAFVWSLCAMGYQKDNPYETRHAETRAPAADLGDLRWVGWRGPVEVRLRDGASLSGT